MKKENVFSKEDLKTIFSTKLEEKDSIQYLHCSHCLERYKVSETSEFMSPSEAMSYFGSVVPFTYPDGVKASIFVLWCKKCGGLVWDSRHLQPYL